MAQRAKNVSHEDIWFKIENVFLPLVEKLPYHRGFDYKIVIGKLHGEIEADAIIEVAFTSMDDLERAAKSPQIEKLIEESKETFQEDSLRIFATHQL